MDMKDKVVLAAAIAATALAAAKLVADKESKISDFRKDWIVSFRAALSECLAEAHVIAGRIKIRSLHGGELTIEHKFDLEKDLAQHWTNFRHAFRMLLLHLNFAETSAILYRPAAPTERDKDPDLSWRRLVRECSEPDEVDLFAAHKQHVDGIDRASPAVLALIRELDSLTNLLLGDYQDTTGRYDDIERHILRATLLGNLTIKPEWNRIKRGERMHRWTIWASGALILLLVAQVIFF